MMNGGIYVYIFDVVYIFLICLHINNEIRELLICVLSFAFCRPRYPAKITGLLF